MTRDQAKAAIDEAIETLRAYKRAKISIASSPVNRLLDEELVKSSKMLLTEAYEIGLAGQPCPKCGGTGKI